MKAALICMSTMGIVFVGAKVKDMKPALAAAFIENRLVTERPSDAAEVAAIELRGRGYEARVRTSRACDLEHGCGARIDPKQWETQAVQRYPTETEDGRPSFFEVRDCPCGSSISYAGLDVVPAAKP